MNAIHYRDSLLEILERLRLGPIRECGEHNFMLRCPFHDDTNPSFSITFHPLKFGLWHCFACGVKGRLEQLVGEDLLEQLPTPSLLQRIQDILSLNQTPSVRFVPPRCPLNGPQEAIQYLCQKRRYSLDQAQKVVERYNVYRWENFIVFPIKDPLLQSEDPKFIAWTARNLSSKGPKMFHPSGMPKRNVLFGLDVCLEEFSTDYCILVEGPFDTIRLYSYEQPSVACLGGPSKEQIEHLSKLFYTVYTLFDGDEQGNKYRKEVSKLNLSNVVNLPIYSEKDPDQLSRNEWEKIWSWSTQHTNVLSKVRRKLRKYTAPPKIRIARHAIPWCLAGISP